jgi:hypothetical protein
MALDNVVDYFIRNIDRVHQKIVSRELQVVQSTSICENKVRETPQEARE